MSSVADRFNAKVPLPIRVILLIAVGLLIAQPTILAPGIGTLWAVGQKILGHAPDCPWRSIITYYYDLESFSGWVSYHENQIEVRRYDQAFDLEEVYHPQRSFWIRKSGSHEGASLLAYHLGEQDRIQERFGETLIREGDIVIDCGAHVGTFVHHALANGASKVVAIDPDPTQVECLRRNFREEIAAGRVVVVPEGVWNEQGTMTLYVVSLHSGASSLLEKPGEKEITVKVTTIDELVGRLELPRVDLIKLDIEGAEREALRGASETLEKYGPALLIDSYHRPDDAEVLPRLIDAAGVGYQASCGWCGLEKGRSKHLKPHVQLYRSAPR